MCGISGILHFDHLRKINKHLLKEMTDIVSYRGPDGEGFFIKDNIGLGHRRLSIIDLERGDQPIYNEDKSISIVFNGEIYNYIELREELKKLGHNFFTESDTETIIHAFEEWGYECQDKLNGMWAFAIWDDYKKELFLSRDRIGEKPLYYCVFDNTFLFGSEIKSILAYGIPKNANLELLEIYLSLGYIPAPFTFYKNVHNLQAGNYLVVRDGIVKEYEYWNLPDINEDNMLSDKNEIYGQFEYLLKDSVRLRMRSDVPFGAFLSGGLDSACIVSLMSELSYFPVESFTIGFEDKAFDERRLARDVSIKFKTNHNEKIVTPETFEKSLQKVVYHYDDPFGDSSAIPTGYVSRFAREKVKMVLTGDGGDEVLSGYTAYQGEKFASQYQKFPKIVRKNFPKIVSFMSNLFRGSIRYKLNRIHNVCVSSNLDFRGRRKAKSSWIEKSIIKDLLIGQKVYSIEEYHNDLFNKCSYKDNFYKLMYLNFKVSLPGDMLVKVDRMSMAYSLETRIPFLDYRLIEFMVNVDKNVKMQGYERKSVLRNSVGKKLPDSLLNAPKKGFEVPLREWFKDVRFENCLESLLDIDLDLDKNIIKTIIEENKNGQKDYGNFIWMLFVLKNWMET